MNSQSGFSRHSMRSEPVAPTRSLLRRWSHPRVAALRTYVTAVNRLLSTEWSNSVVDGDDQIAAVSSSSSSEPIALTYDQNENQYEHKNQPEDGDDQIAAVSSSSSSEPIA